MIQKISGYEGDIVLDRSYANGTPRKRLDCSKLNALGWEGPQIALEEGIRTVYDERCKLFEGGAI